MSDGEQADGEDHVSRNPEILDGAKKISLVRLDLCDNIAEWNWEI